MLIITYFPIIPFYFAFYRTTPTEKTYKRSPPPPRCISILFVITLVLSLIFHLDTSFITAEISLLIQLFPPKYCIFIFLDLSFYAIVKLIFSSVQAYVLSYCALYKCSANSSQQFVTIPFPACL